MKRRADRKFHGLGQSSFFLAALLIVSSFVTAAPETRTVVDETGRRVELPLRIERIVSLAPSLTEIMYALDLEDRLVGVTAYCDYPPAAQQKPSVGDVLNPSLETIVQLRPDVVLGTTAGNRRATVQALEQLGVPLYGVDAHSVEGIFDSIRHLAELTSVPARGEELVGRLQRRLAAIPVPPEGSPPRVLFIVWLEPLITAGSDTFLNDVLRRAGAESVTADLEPDWPRLSLEEVIERDPDYLVVPSTDILRASLDRVVRKGPWQRLRAVRQGRIIWLDEAVLRPGPRVAQVIEELARALHASPAREVKAKK